MDESYEECVLSENSAIDQALLIDPLDRDFGSDIEFESIDLRIGRRPSARNLAKFYEATGQELPKEYSLYVSHNIYLISVTVGIMNKGGWKNVKQLGVQLEYDENPRVTILDLLPQTEFIETAGGHFRSNTDITLNGKAKVSDALIEGVGDGEIISGDAKIESSNSANIAASFSFSVMTPKVIATGVGDHSAHWLFKKDKEPLVGDQTVAHTLLVPLHVEDLNLKARLYASVSGFGGLPVKLTSDNWISLEIDLE